MARKVTKVTPEDAAAQLHELAQKARDEGWSIYDLLTPFRQTMERVGFTWPVIIGDTVIVHRDGQKVGQLRLRSVDTMLSDALALLGVKRVTTTKECDEPAVPVPEPIEERDREVSAEAPIKDEADAQQAEAEVTEAADEAAQADGKAEDESKSKKRKRKKKKGNGKSNE